MPTHIQVESNRIESSDTTDASSNQLAAQLAEAGTAKNEEKAKARGRDATGRGGERRGEERRRRRALRARRCIYTKRQGREARDETRRGEQPKPCSTSSTSFPSTRAQMQLRTAEIRRKSNRNRISNWSAEGAWPVAISSSDLKIQSAPGPLVRAGLELR